MEKQKLVSVSDYAKLCRITVQAIYRRINDNEIEPKIIGGCQFIDIFEFPPEKAKKAGRKHADHHLNENNRLGNQ